MKRVVLTLIFLGVVIPMAWILYYKYEGDVPEADISLPSQYLKKSYEMNLTVRDRGTGLRQVMVSLMQKGNEKVLLDKTYPPNIGNANYSTSGELSPLFNDPYLKTIGIGTRIFLGGAQGYVTGLDMFRAVKNQHTNTVVIMISAYSTTEIAVEAMNENAYDFVPKTFGNNELRHTIAKALELKTLEHEKERRSSELETHLHFDRIIGNSTGMQAIYKRIEQISPTKTNVLVTGENGTGKELIARTIHENSDRKDQPFVVVNCGGIPETLMEREFFGHVKGSFTGATGDKKGLFEAANKGTIFLDETGELSTFLQVKLLRAVQETKFKPIGDTREIDMDVWIISATNKKLGKDISKLSSYAIDFLNKYSFIGNVRELENLIERSVALSSTNIILPESLTISTHKRRRWIEGVQTNRFDLEDVSAGVDLDDILAKIESSYQEKAMELAGGNKKKAAYYLNLSMRSMRYRLDKATGFIKNFIFIHTELEEA